MAATDSGLGDELADIVSFVEAGLLDDDDLFEEEILQLINDNVSFEKASYPCEKCEKVCKSKSGLVRHMRSKHHEEQEVENEHSLANILHPLTLKMFVLSCAEKLAEDMCFPDIVRSTFSVENFTFTNEESYQLWMKLKAPVAAFHGDAEKFYSQFYGLLTENLIPKLEWTNSNLLLGEVANKILSHLTGHSVEKIDLNTPVIFSDKDINKLQYLAGYVIRKTFTKVRFSSTCQSVYNQQCSMILLACKEQSDLVHHTLIDARDRGGLWKIRKEIINVFQYCEEIFRINTVNVVKIVYKELVQKMVSDCRVLSMFCSVCTGIDPKPSKELSLNLLEHIIGLFVRVRSFSYAKNVTENYNVSKNSGKKRSLRKEIKKSGCMTDVQGH